MCASRVRYVPGMGSHPNPPSFTADVMCAPRPPFLVYSHIPPPKLLRAGVEEILLARMWKRETQVREKGHLQVECTCAQKHAATTGHPFYRYMSPPLPATHRRQASSYASSRSVTHRRVSKRAQLHLPSQRSRRSSARRPDPSP